MNVKIKCAVGETVGIRYEVRRADKKPLDQMDQAYADTLAELEKITKEGV